MLRQTCKHRGGIIRALRCRMYVLATLDSRGQYRWELYKPSLGSTCHFSSSSKAVPERWWAGGLAGHHADGQPVEHGTASPTKWWANHTQGNPTLLYIARRTGRDGWKRGEMLVIRVPHRRCRGQFTCKNRGHR